MFSSQVYLLYLIGIMIMTGIIKEFNLFSGIYNFLMKHIKKKKTLVWMMSLFAGVLPIPGRVVISSSLLDTIATKDKVKRKMFGLIDFIATHHYYLWSPLEKTIILPMAAFSLTYGEMMKYTAPLLVVYLLYKDHNSDTVHSSRFDIQS